MDNKKICSKCKQILDIICFHKSKNTKDGYKYECKECRKEYAKKTRHKTLDRERKYRKENIDKIRERERKYRENNKEKISDNFKIYYQKNKFHLNKNKRDWSIKNIEHIRNYREQNKERDKIYREEYYKENKEKIIYNQRNRRIIDNNKKSNTRARSLLALNSGKINKQKYCSNCGIETKLAMHHEDYDSPLDVIFLCKKCHANLHTGMFGLNYVK